jgi:hypothetical protein
MANIKAEKINRNRKSKKNHSREFEVHAVVFAVISRYIFS